MFPTTRLASSIWLLTIVTLPIASVWGEQPDAMPENAELAIRVQGLIDDLDADDYSTRQAAQERLIEIGQPALAAVRRALHSKSAEQRYRARLIDKQIRQGTLQRAFAEFGRQAEESVDVEEGMWLIARILDPVVRRADLSRQLDEMAAAVRKRLGSPTDPAKVAPREIVDAICHVLGTQFNLSGSVTDYDHPDNSSLHRVLKRRQGLPILLSHIAVSVAERLDVPVVGIAVPSRYMIKYDGARAPKGFEKNDIIVDPFGNWRVLSVDEVPTVIRSFDPDRHLVPSPPRSTLARMLRNLESDLAEVGQSELAAEVGTYRLLIESNPQPMPRSSK